MLAHFYLTGSHNDIIHNDVNETWGQLLHLNASPKTVGSATFVSFTSLGLMVRTNSRFFVS